MAGKTNWICDLEIKLKSLHLREFALCSSRGCDRLSSRIHFSECVAAFLAGFAPGSRPVSGSYKSRRSRHSPGASRLASREPTETLCLSSAFQMMLRKIRQRFFAFGSFDRTSIRPRPSARGNDVIAARFETTSSDLICNGKPDPYNWRHWKFERVS